MLTVGGLCPERGREVSRSHSRKDTSSEKKEEKKQRSLTNTEGLNL